MEILITGGCGFIGTNLVLDRLERGDRVRVLDNLSREGTALNRDGLRARNDHGGLDLVEGDIRDSALVAELADGVDAVFHLAGQVAVTTSVADPRADFEVNALGTLNVLEAVRAAAPEAVVVYASTNKVYGGLGRANVGATKTRYELRDYPDGVPESMPLDFHSPYGCSKGAGDQYVLDYARIYGMRSVSLRQSCIYGPWQYGNEDQGWLAHFAIRALNDEPVTIYGDGLQVRDVLFVGDLLELYDRVLERADLAAGKAYNIGGGPVLRVSLLESLQALGEVVGHDVPVSFEAWRPGDQRVYVSDVRRAAELGWSPTTPFRAGLDALVAWLEDARVAMPSAASHPVQDR